jgi:hypothetical protein
MIKVQMSQKHVGYICGMYAQISEALIQRSIAMQVIVREKFGVLLVPYSIVNQNYPISIHCQKASHSPRTKVVFVSRIGARPKRLGNHPKHSSSIQFEKSGVYSV